MNISYIFLADGFEEIEALATLDILRRAEIPVLTVSINETTEVTGAHQVTVIADLLIDEIDAPSAPWLILPGGMPGAMNLAACERLNEMLARQVKEGRRVAAICASPAVVLSPLGLLDGIEATCYPGCEGMGAEGTMYTGHRVDVTPQIITGRGPGVTFDFALAIVEATSGQEVADKVAAGMLLK